MRLIIAANPAVVGVASTNALTAFLEAKGWSVWHWYEYLWLIDGAPEETKLKDLRREISKAIPTIQQVLVMTTEGQIKHSGMVPADSAEWFAEHWHRRNQ